MDVVDIIMSAMICFPIGGGFSFVLEVMTSYVSRLGLPGEQNFTHKESQFLKQSIPSLQHFVCLFVCFVFRALAGGGRDYLRLQSVSVIIDC